MTQGERQNATRIIETERLNAGGGVSDAELARRISAKYPDLFGTAKNDIRALERKINRMNNPKESKIRYEAVFLARLAPVVMLLPLVLFFVVLAGGVTSTGMEPFTYSGFYLWMIALAITAGIMLRAVERV